MVKPMSDEEWLVRWTRLAEARAYFEQLIEDRLEHSREDLISGMVHARLDDGRTALDREHIVTHLVEFISAGKAAMADLIASTVVMFDQQPEVPAELRQEPDLWANVVEEALRMRGNALGLLRVATQDVEIGGFTVPRGARVWLLVSAANHDPDHSRDPGRFDLHRDNVDDHLAFGRGIHKCIGSPLTRVACRGALHSTTACRTWHRWPGRCRATSRRCWRSCSEACGCSGERTQPCTTAPPVSPTSSATSAPCSHSVTYSRPSGPKAQFVGSAPPVGIRRSSEPSGSSSAICPWP